MQIGDVRGAGGRVGALSCGPHLRQGRGLAGHTKLGVDQMAKMAITCGVEVDYLPYYTDLLPDLRRKCFSMWSEYFDERSRSKGIWYKTIQPNILRIPWFHESDLTRSDIV
ncbi:hypothetical protein ACJJTC_008384 [Scirpophaga incertulas]